MSLKSLFPVFEQYPELVYLDNAATTQKPQAVIDAVVGYYRASANVNRGLYGLARQTTAHYEMARTKAQLFLSANRNSEIIFTSGTTAALNLVARAFLEPNLASGQEIVVSVAEHHSNFVIWQQLASKYHCRLRVCRLDNEYRLDLNHMKDLISAKTALVAINHVSNVTGAINPVKEVASLARNKDVPIVVDGAQAVAHLPVDVGDLGVDFYCFSAHKAYGPTGVGVLYAAAQRQTSMEPWLMGGDMVSGVELARISWADFPYKFEAGTPNVAGIIGLAAALDFLNGQDWSVITKLENELVAKLITSLVERGFKTLSPKSQRVALTSFTTDVHPHDLARLLAEKQVAARAGFHCAEPFYRSQGENFGSLRFSCGLYNDHTDIEAGLSALDYALEVMKAYA